MANPRPLVRALVVCESVLIDPAEPGRISLIGLLTSIRSTGNPPYPYRHPALSLFTQLTECRRIGDVRAEVRQTDTDAVVYRTRATRLTFQNDPLAVHNLRFRIRNCPFPAPGLYGMQIWYDNSLLAQQPLVLR